MSRMRIHKLKDGTEIVQREWESDSGIVFWCPEKSCVFCKKCEDVVYDSNGPYMFACEKIEQTEAGYEGKCPEFEIDEEEMKKQDELSKTRAERQERVKETVKFLDDNPEIARAFRETLFNALMFGYKEDEVTDDGTSN